MIEKANWNHVHEIAFGMNLEADDLNLDLRVEKNLPSPRWR